MNEQSKTNKKAWEYRAYEFWNSQYTPQELANISKDDPIRRLKIHKNYFKSVEGKKIANICGSSGKRAIPLAILGAEVSVFDISEENKRFALEAAKYAGIDLNYVVGDVYDIDLESYENSFDIVYSEGGILHYFNDLDQLMKLLYAILKAGGTLILSDFHPLRRIAGVGNFKAGTTDRENSGEYSFDYFSTELISGDVAYKQFFTDTEKSDFPDVLLKLHTLSSIMNAVIGAGFVIKNFEEHPDWYNPKVPGEFTILAAKE